MVRWGSSRASSYARVRIFGTEDLTRGERILVGGNKVSFEGSIEEFPGTVLGDFWSDDGHCDKCVSEGLECLVARSGKMIVVKIDLNDDDERM